MWCYISTVSSSLARNPYVLANILILCSFLNLLVLFLNMVPRTMLALDSSNFQQPNGFLFHHTPCFTAENWERQEDLGTVTVCPSTLANSVGGSQWAPHQMAQPPSKPASPPFCAGWWVGGARLTWFHWLHWVLGCNSRMSKVGMMEEQEMRGSTCGNHG